MFRGVPEDQEINDLLAVSSEETRNFRRRLRRDIKRQKKLKQKQMNRGGQHES